jgi:hypothetical protein
MKTTPWKGLLLMMMLGPGACVDLYDPPVSDDDVGYLVVDGVLNAAKGEATVFLTRTIPVKSNDEVPAESGASVWIEDEEGTLYPLTETQGRLYSGDVSNVSSGSKYRLVVHTRDNHEYVSEFTEVVESPGIDSISYSVLEEGVEFSVNTHDPAGSARHFRWKYMETYEYRSNFHSSYMFADKEVIVRPPDRSIYTCWKSEPSTGILVTSTNHLKESIVSRFPVTFISKGSLKLSVKYRLLVEQQALTQEGYDYWLGLQKSTEQLGGLFDPLPSEVTGNIRSTTHPDEEVLGFFSASTVTQKILYVKWRDLPPEEAKFYNNHDSYCELDTLFLADLPNVASFVLLATAVTEGPSLIGYTTSSNNCLDCRSFGGSTTKPEFWE